VNVYDISIFSSFLQAYSVYDEDIGYCQGQSFLAAVLLLHVSNFPCNKWHGAAKFILFSAWFYSPFFIFHLSDGDYTWHIFFKMYFW